MIVTNDDDVGKKILKLELLAICLGELTLFRFSDLAALAPDSKLDTNRPHNFSGVNSAEVL